MSSFSLAAWLVLASSAVVYEAHDGDIMVYNTIHQNLRSNFSGGAIFLSNPLLTLTAEHCVFSRCESVENGGAIFSVSAALRLKMLCVSYCSTHELGFGQFYFSQVGNTTESRECDFSITNCGATESATGFEGTIWALGGKGDVRNINSSHNQVLRWGSGISYRHTEYRSISFVNCIENSAGDSIVVFFFALDEGEAQYFNVVGNNQSTTRYSVVWGNGQENRTSLLKYSDMVLYDNLGAIYIFSNARYTSSSVSNCYVGLATGQEAIGNGVTVYDMSYGIFPTYSMPTHKIVVGTYKCAFEGFTYTPSAFFSSSALQKMARGLFFMHSMLF